MQVPPASQRHCRPAARAASPAGLRLRGWLILIGVGLVLLPLWLALFLAEELAPAFTGQVWTALTAPGSSAYHPLNAPVLIFELGGNALLLVCALWLAVLFFLKHRRFPFMAVIFLLSAVVFYLLDYFAAMQLAAAQGLQGADSIADLVGALALCALLVPYLLVSRRVKATFVQ